MSVSKEQILSLAELSRLSLSEEEIEELQDSLNEIVQYMEKLKGLDLKDVEPMMRVSDLIRPLRPDKPRTGLSKSQVFKNAPKINLGHFSVPKTVN